MEIHYINIININLLLLLLLLLFREEERDIRPKAENTAVNVQNISNLNLKIRNYSS